MPIIFSVVAQGITVLAKHAICPGNFDAVTGFILERISQQQDESLTYSQGPYHFHYIRKHGFIYMCITDDEFQRTRAFLFLIEIKRRFRASYGGDVLAALPYVINAEFSLVLAREMNLYSTSNDIDIDGQDEIKKIMAGNVDDMTMGGEHLRLLVNDPDNPPRGPVAAISPEQARWMSRRTVTLYVLLAVAHIVVIYFLVSIMCGGLAWQHCL